MFNRREVILSSAAVIAGVNRAGASSTPVTVPDTVPDGSRTVHDMATAAACTDCAAACTVLAQLCVERVAAGKSEYAALHGLSRDCGDLCTVAATLLGRQGPLAPAICQACADACDRLIDLSSNFTVRDLRDCRTIAGRCAIECRNLISNS
jgi:hypothetical protein